MKTMKFIIIAVMAVATAIVLSCELFQTPVRDNTYDPKYEGDAFVPGVPDGLTLEAETDLIRVSWNAVTGADNYTIYIGTSPDLDADEITTLGQRTDYNLDDDNDGVYTYELGANSMENSTSAPAYGSEYYVWVTASANGVEGSGAATGSIMPQAIGSPDEEFKSGLEEGYEYFFTNNPLYDAFYFDGGYYITFTSSDVTYHYIYIIKYDPEES